MALERPAERWWAAAMAAVAVWLHIEVAVHARTGWWWLLAGMIVVSRGLLARQVHARVPAEAWRPMTYWVGHLATTITAITAITAAFGPPRGVDAVLMGLLAGPVLTILAFATGPRVGPRAGHTQSGR